MSLNKENCFNVVATMKATEFAFKSSDEREALAERFAHPTGAGDYPKAWPYVAECIRNYTGQTHCLPCVEHMREALRDELEFGVLEADDYRKMAAEARAAGNEELAKCLELLAPIFS